MSDLGYLNTAGSNLQAGNYLRRRTDWSAIWGGVFTFCAIWSVFGALGAAIFASAANPNAPRPVSGMNWGMGIWSIILTIIAMYVAGRVTGHLAVVSDRSDGVNHGQIMFGLSVVSVLVLTILGGAALSGGQGVPGGAHSSYVLSVFANLGWFGFVSLLLGWLAAMGGASAGVSGAARMTTTGTPAETTTQEKVRGIRPAA